jgi:hypothetical protein
MTELLKAAPWLGSILFPVLLFVILPYLYYALSMEIHKDASDLVKASIDCDISNAERTAKIPIANFLSEIESQIYLFNLRWWFVLSVLFVIGWVISIGEISRNASQLSESCRASSSIFSILSPPTVKDVSTKEVQICTHAKVMLIYPSLIVVGLLMRFLWERIEITRDLKQKYSRLSKRSSQK